MFTAKEYVVTATFNRIIKQHYPQIDEEFTTDYSLFGVLVAYKEGVRAVEMREQREGS